MRHIVTYGLIILLISISYPILAQFSANNLMEFQRGNLIGNKQNDLLTFYDQLDLRYRYKGFRFNTRVDQFHSSEQNNYEYIQLSRLGVSYKKRGLEINAGNFYETLGRGLLLRGYEIKNSILEDRIYRSRQGFYKDLLGASGSYRYKFMQIKALWGKSLNNQLPAGHNERRIDKVGASEMNFQFKQQTIGVIYLNHQVYEQQSHFSSFHLGGNLFNVIDYYGEFAQAFMPNKYSISFNENDRYGAYFNLNYSSPKIGVSFELKDYHNFVIGSGIADAPTLVKEHSYRLLNRSTHVAEFFDESGYQLEVFYNTRSNAFLTFNHSKGINRFGDLEFTFYEFFIDANYNINQWQLKSFVDYSKDDVTAEKNRITTGIYASKALNNSWAIKLDWEGQSIQRNDQRFINSYWSLTFSKSSKLSASIQYELTSDPFLISENKFRTYPALNIGYRINTQNNIQIFAGERRGGPACTSGICYEVLDFKGTELRYSYKF